MSSNTSESLILARGERDLDEGLHHLSTRLRALGHPLLAAGVTGSLRVLQLRERFRDDVAFLCALARRVTAGEDPTKLAEENVARAMRLKELGLVVRTHDPHFAPVLESSRALMAARLPDLARMVAVEDPKDYEDLVRRAFPDRAHVDDIVTKNAEHFLSLLDHARVHPHLLRIPHGWVARLDEVAREIVEWETARVRKGIDEIYA